MELCITDKDGKLYDENTIKYVLIHEISHIINPLYGHG
jgi:predicted metal-dependent hydrolase